MFNESKFRTIAFAGNLDKEKSGFIYKLDIETLELMDYKVFNKNASYGDGSTGLHRKWTVHMCARGPPNTRIVIGVVRRAGPVIFLFCIQNI